MTIRIKRVYEPQHQNDGTRVLVDRLWPRGISKTAAAVHHWLKDIAPSTRLRKWFGHDPSKWSEFKLRYFQELNANQDAVKQLSDIARDRVVTLLFAAREAKHNHVVALREYMLGRSGDRAISAHRKKSQ